MKPMKPNAEEIKSLINGVIAEMTKDLITNGTWDPGDQTPGPVLVALISNLVTMSCAVTYALLDRAMDSNNET